MSLHECQIPQVGQVWRSSDHRNRNCPWLQILEVNEEWVIVQRYKDKELRQPHGAGVPIRRRAWKRPAVRRVV